MSRLESLRANPLEWRRRGLRTPEELEQLVERKLQAYVPEAPGPDARYADFFAPRAARAVFEEPAELTPEHRAVWERLRHFGEQVVAAPTGF